MKWYLVVAALFFFSQVAISPWSASAQTVSGPPDGASQDQPATAKPAAPQVDAVLASDSAGAEHAGMNHDGMNMESLNFIQEAMSHGTSGTSAAPNSTPMSMLMTFRGNWMLMFHGEGFLTATQQSGPRGGDKVFSSNMVMPMAQRRLGPGQLTLRTMLSLEPATVTGRFYPLLFQQGETAFGRPISDGQHPHNFFMEVAALYDVKLGEHGLLSFYAAPVGDPAMGPTAYPHRESASENPVAALGHHLEDSTHISDDVITAGLAYRSVRLEASGFHGREPDEFRWDIDSGKLDSWSTRLTAQPGQRWSAQYSFAHLTNLEASHPGEDVDRMTASVMYHRSLRQGNWATTLLWGRNHSRATGEIFNGYLAESTLQFARKNHVWTRVENVDRTTELLFGSPISPLGADERFLARVQAYTAGYDRDIKMVPHLETALGAQTTTYHAPGFLTPFYGEHPFGALVFLRIRAVGREH